MNIDKLKRGNILAKRMIPRIDELLELSSKSSYVRISDALYGLTECDSDFKTKFNQLLYETKQKFQKEFDEL